MHGEYELLPDLLVLLSAENIYRVKEDLAVLLAFSLATKIICVLHCTVKNVSYFPVPSGDFTNQLSPAVNNSIIPGQGEFGK